jgi:hypothetical protein
MWQFKAACRAATLASRQYCCIGLKSAKPAAPWMRIKVWIALITLLGGIATLSFRLCAEWVSLVAH